jgi:hypothetical protein
MPIGARNGGRSIRFAPAKATALANRPTFRRARRSGFSPAALAMILGALSAVQIAMARSSEQY